MSNWNEAYTRRKSKEMLTEAQEEYKKIKRGPPHPRLYASPSIKRREQERRDKFAWKIGIFAITLISMAGIVSIWWALSL